MVRGGGQPRGKMGVWLGRDCSRARGMVRSEGQGEVMLVLEEGQQR